tara:strand:- start:1615 stop:1827 length:213 start_codon:yes stop_codon:yes gene_type:complete
MKYLLFNWDYVGDFGGDPSELTDAEFEALAESQGGQIYESKEDFESAFNAEHFSVHTHQLRIINKYSTVK